ncbi:uncharacterized protein LOC110455767 [Mizuhopecten yessoensis]|uniref:Uncharacterized protein n=1 Tax=Mizuhopecten yessoensis TaxID=6573 RepID=A0A210QCE2_MIZYE|nr:uncharacterized protein LOC110455767 [Mizuhopecten yessoensis]OWF46409.1 hypothetical protein KP79_PYT23987 [Mizuhopecten yessoensis]
MDADEIALLQDYKSYFQKNVDPITVTNGLRTHGRIDASIFKSVYDVDRKSFGDRAEVWKEVIQIITKLCPFPSFLSILDTTGYTDLSLDLSVHIRSIKGHLNDVVRLQRGNCRGSNHKFAQELFVSLKINTHNNTFKNPRENLHELSQRFRAKFVHELDLDKKMLIADKYAACLCAEIDSHTMLYVRKFPTHGLFKELEDLIPETSNTHVTEVAFRSRMAIACAIAEDTERGEEFLTDARVASYHIGACVQLDNMLYIQVFNYLCKFENNPTDDLRDTIIKLAGMSLQALEDEDDVTRIFWKRMFLLRMVYCLLGISNRCDLIPRCVARQKYVYKARQLMAEIDKIWDGIESRRRMFYYVARARLHDLDSRRVKQEISDMGRKSQNEGAMLNIEAAIFQIEKAIALGEEGNFGETCYVKLYASELKEKKLQLILQQTGRSARAGHEHSDKSEFACEHNSYEDEIAGKATENMDMTSYRPYSTRLRINQSSDNDTLVADKSKVLHHASITDIDKSVSLQKDPRSIPNTRGNESLTNTDRQSNCSLDIRQERQFTGNGRHQVLVSQHDIYRPLCVQSEKCPQHVESCLVYTQGNVCHQPRNAHYQIGNAHHHLLNTDHQQGNALHQPGNAHHQPENAHHQSENVTYQPGHIWHQPVLVQPQPENVGHESENANHQPGIVKHHFGNSPQRPGSTNQEQVNALHELVDAHNRSENANHQPVSTCYPHHQPEFISVTQGVNSRRLPMQNICQSQTYDAQGIFQPRSATYQQHIEIQVNQQDLRQPESTTHQSGDVSVETLSYGGQPDKDIRE